MNYQIIKDEQKLQAFIDWLPDLEDQEKYYCCLFSRKKYTEAVGRKKDKAQLKRFLTNKERMLEKIQQLETRKGSYTMFGEVIPEESLALYINPNPRDLTLATYDGIIKLTEALKKGTPRFNPHAEILSCIQRSTSRQLFLDFDVDQKPFDLTQLSSLINPEALDILETRGGYHLLVRLKAISAQYKATFFRAIQSLGVDQVGDQLLPVPGCTQGGFIPTFVKEY